MSLLTGQQRLCFVKSYKDQNSAMMRASLTWWLPSRAECVILSFHRSLYLILQQTKRIFDGSRDSNVVDFGGNRDNDKVHGIIKGKLSLTREEMEVPFVDVIRRILDSCLELLTGHNVLVGFLLTGYFLKELSVDSTSFSWGVLGSLPTSRKSSQSFSLPMEHRSSPPRSLRLYCQLLISVHF